MSEIPAYHIFPLGDSALTVDFGNTVNESINKYVTSRSGQLRAQPLPGMIESIPSYSSLSIMFDIGTVRKIAPQSPSAFEWMKEKIVSFFNNPIVTETGGARFMRIPVCFDDEFGT